MSAGLYGRPTAAELVEAVIEFLTTEVAAATTGAVAFHTKVAANALRIVQRELHEGATGADAAAAALNRLGFDDEAAVAAAVRAGDFDERGDELTAALETLVRHRLAVAHPGYAGD
ncbi:hypothetical protein BHQ15_16720 [Mycolicibacillus koreensis]|nr:hypothetical protein BHQ15_16720 [Mycolicibacillus koreensis]